MTDMDPTKEQGEDPDALEPSTLVPLVTRGVQRARHDVEQAGDQALVDLAVDRVWDDYLKNQAPQYEAAWYELMSHLSAKPFTIVGSTMEYNPAYIHHNRDMMKLFSDDEEDKLTGRYMAFHDSSRRQYDTQGLIWHFETITEIGEEHALSRIEFFAPETVPLAEDGSSGTWDEELATAFRIIRSQKVTVRTKPHTTFDVASERIGIRKHAVPLQTLKRTVQDHIILQTDCLMFNVKAVVIGSDEHTYHTSRGGGVDWKSVNDLASGGIHLQDFSDNRKKPHVTYGDDDLETGVGVYDQYVERAVKQLDNESPDLKAIAGVLELLRRSH